MFIADIATLGAIARGDSNVGLAAEVKEGRWRLSVGPLRSISVLG